MPATDEFKNLGVASQLRGFRKGAVITPSGSELAAVTRGVMVSADCTITGVLADDTASLTYGPFSAGVAHAMQFKIISAVSGGATVTALF